MSHFQIICSKCFSSTSINLFMWSISHTGHLCVSFFLASKILKGRDGNYYILGVPTSSNTKQGDTQYRILENLGISVFQAFHTFCIPNYKIFQGSSIFSYQKSNNALPLVNTWSNENLPKSCLSYSHPSNIYYLVCQPCQNKQKTFNILRILTYWPFTQKGTQRWLLHKNNSNVKAIIIL